MPGTAKQLYLSDLYRYYRNEKRSCMSVLSAGFQLSYLKAMRYAKNGNGKIGRIFWRMRLRSLQKRTGVQISWRAQIGKGFYIGHMGPIAVNEKAIIGDNCNISFGVVIGADNRGSREGSPRIGNRVWIGTNAIIVGSIKIDDDVLIAPGAFVNFNVPSHSIVIGNPAVIHARENATEGFITNAV